MRRIRQSLRGPIRAVPAVGPYDAVVTYVGRALQLFGLIVLPAALLYGLTSKDPGALYRELGMLAIGGAAFLLGTRLVRPR